jgi:hypothetical protein
MRKLRQRIALLICPRIAVEAVEDFVELQTLVAEQREEAAEEKCGSARCANGWRVAGVGQEGWPIFRPCHACGNQTTRRGAVKGEVYFLDSDGNRVECRIISCGPKTGFTLHPDRTVTRFNEDESGRKEWTEPLSDSPVRGVFATWIWDTLDESSVAD